MNGFTQRHKAHHGDNNNWGEYNTVEEVIAAAQHRAKVASKTMPDCLGGGIGGSSPVWMRDYSQPNDKEPKNPYAKTMIGTLPLSDTFALHRGATSVLTLYSQPRL